MGRETKLSTMCVRGRLPPPRCHRRVVRPPCMPPPSGPAAPVVPNVPPSMPPGPAFLPPRRLPEMTPMQLNIVLSLFLNDQKIDPVSNYLTRMYMYNVLGCVFSNLSCKRNALGLSYGTIVALSIEMQISPINPSDQLSQLTVCHKRQKIGFLAAPALYKAELLQLNCTQFSSLGIFVSKNVGNQKN